MLEKLYPQFIHSLRPFLQLNEYIYFLNTSKEEFGEIRKGAVELVLKGELVDRFINDEEFRSFLETRVKNSSKQLTFKCNSLQAPLLLALQKPIFSVKVTEYCAAQDGIETEAAVHKTLQSMEGLVSCLYLDSFRLWRKGNYFHHLPSSLTWLSLENAISLKVFPYIPTLTTVFINIADDLRNVQALSHVKEVSIKLCRRLVDVTPLARVHTLKLQSVGGSETIDVSALCDVHDLRLSFLTVHDTKALRNSHSIHLKCVEGFTNYYSFVNAVKIEISGKKNETIDFTLFHHARTIMLGGFTLVCDNAQQRAERMIHLKMLSFSGTFSTQSVFPYLSIIPSLTQLVLFNIRDEYIDVSSLWTIPAVVLYQFSSLSTVVGLEKGKFNLYFSSISNLETFSPPDHIIRIGITNCKSFMDLTSFKNIQKLKIESCHSLSDLSPLSDGKVTLLLLKDCSQIISLHGAENIQELCVHDCKNLVDISCLVDGSNRKIGIGGHHMIEDYRVLEEIGKYKKEKNFALRPGYFSDFVFIK